MEPLGYCLGGLEILYEHLVWLFIARGLLHARAKVNGFWREVPIVGAVKVALVKDRVMLLRIKLVGGING